MPKFISCLKKKICTVNYMKIQILINLIIIINNNKNIKKYFTFYAFFFLERERELDAFPILFLLLMYNFTLIAHFRIYFTYSI